MAGLDEAVGVSVETALEWFARDVVQDVIGENFGFKVRDGTGLRGGTIRGVANDKDVRVGFGLQGVLVGGDKVEFIAEAGAFDHGVAHIGRDGDQKIVRDLLFVPRNDGFFVGIHTGDGEVVDNGNTFLVEKFAENSGGDGFGESAGHRGDVDDLSLVTQAHFLKPRIGEKAILQRSDGALDRHLTDVDDEATALPRLQTFGEGFSAFKGVKLVDVYPPVGTVGHAFDLFRRRMDAGGNDQNVIGQRRPVF